MKVEGVNFVDEEVKKMKKREFINKHKTSFFLDRTETERENILSDIYDRIVNARPPSGDII
ncbi:hypothetical protein ACMSDS_21515 [Bacteroides thetaiotaomicron]|jgi:hypothetical protein|uniref:hypothetical protein n=1 Tax=Bacteroides thetaiotaomicron TaxID=818 RepID=UPI00206DFD1C|nr:MAG TPA: hypothetical protein [Caudoviricetes sp.]